MSKDLVVPVCPTCDYENTDHFRFCPKCRFPLMLVAGKYRMEKALAQGGMGQVYLAQHVRLDHDTERVIKVIKPEIFASPGMDVRFRREVQVTAALSQRNDHIVRIYDDFGEEEGFGHYYVMEFLRGQTLKDIIPKEGRLPDEVTFHVFYQFCRAMAAAHREKIVHRDLKPDNVFLIQREEDDHFVKVIDFGIARPEDAEAGTQLTQGILGTPQYMSPEQCENKDIDARSDIYSMGIMLYEMLTGENSYGLTRQELSGSSPLGMISAHLMRDLVPIRKVREDLPEGLEAVLAKSMARKSEYRFDSVETFWNAIAAARPLGHAMPTFGGKKSNHLRVAENTANSATPSPDFPPQTADLGSTGSRVMVAAAKAGGQTQPAPTKGGSRNLLWAFSVLGILAFGVIVWFILAKKKDPGTTPGASRHAARRSPVSVRKIALVRKVPTPTVRAVLARRPIVPKRVVVPVRRIVVRPVVRRKRPRRRLPTRRRRAPRRRKVKRGGGPCGVASAGFRWVYALLSKPRSGRVRVGFSGCRGCRSLRRAGGYCLKIPSKGARKMRVSINGYVACSYRLPVSKSSIRWHLKQEDPDDLADENYNCIR